MLLEIAEGSEGEGGVPDSSAIRDWMYLINSGKITGVRCKGT